jgi:hypothetical protein
MKLILIIFIWLNYGVILGQSKSIVNDSIIEWNLKYKLSWSDFLGKPDEDIFGSAMTSYKIEIIPSEVKVDENDRVRGYENLSVKANFYKYYSWAIENNIQLLHHEQLHFDIAELFARKIRKEFKKSQLNKEARFTTYLEHYNLLWKECREYQKRYDHETRNGLETEINEKWIVKINEELEVLQDSK